MCWQSRSMVPLYCNLFLAGIGMIPWTRPSFSTSRAWRLTAKGTCGSSTLAAYVDSGRPCPHFVVDFCFDVRFIAQLNIFSNVSTDVMNFAPKLVVYNLDSNTVLRTFVFPNDVAPYNSSFLNDIVVDELNHVAYISDTGVVGGIIVYDWTSNSARRWGGDVTQQFDPTYTVIINGVEYPTVRNNADGIALSTDLQTLYYCVVDGNHLFSIPTRYLRDFGTTDDFLHSQVTVVGQKLSASDGMAVDSSGRLYFGSFSNSAVVSWDPSTPLTPQTQTILCSDAEQMQWQDTFAFDNQGNLYFTTNRLQAYFLVGPPPSLPTVPCAIIPPLCTVCRTPWISLAPPAAISACSKSTSTRNRTWLRKILGISPL